MLLSIMPVFIVTIATVGGGNRRGLSAVEVPSRSGSEPVEPRPLADLVLDSEHLPLRASTECGEPGSNCNI